MLMMFRDQPRYHECCLSCHWSSTVAWSERVFDR